MIIDAALTMAWCLSDEISPEHFRLLEDVDRNGAHAPSLWPLEVVNALISAARSNRISDASIQKVLAELYDLRVQIDTLTAHRAWSTTVVLALKHRLSAYDAVNRPEIAGGSNS